MPEIGFRLAVTGERRLSAAFEALPDHLQQKLLGPVRRLTAIMYQRAIAGEPVRTGRLRADTQSFVDIGHTRGGDYVRGRVRVLPDEGEKFNVKAAALEYGAHALIGVKSHAMTLDHAFAVAIAPKECMVKAYARRVHIAELAFLRNARAGIDAELKEAAEAAAAEITRDFAR